MVVCQLIDDSCSFRSVNYPLRSWANAIGCYCDADGAATNDGEVADGVGCFDDVVVAGVGCG